MTPLPGGQLLGVDVSHWQARNLPWTTWRNFGVRFAIIRAGIGYVGDHGHEMHRRQARAAGLYTGSYWAILAHDSETTRFDPIQAAQNFHRLIPPGDELPPFVDVEALGLNATILWAFLQEFERIRPNSGVGIYTSQMFWHMLIGRGHREFARFPLWVAMYGTGGQQDPPLLPDIWNTYICYQFRYKAGYLPGYDRDLDINLWSGRTPMPTTDDQLRGLIDEANQIRAHADTSIQAASATRTVTASMITKLNTMLTPPPPPPAAEHTMSNKTNQQVINLFFNLFGGLARLDAVLTVAQRSTPLEPPSTAGHPLKPWHSPTPSARGSSPRWAKTKSQIKDRSWGAAPDPQGATAKPAVRSPIAAC
jgi:GH25 family lysozyme M1 (1,4-beta-N-acetylmuramidase)